MSSAANTTHGTFVGSRTSPSPEYTAWAGMVRRCENPQHDAYKHYGGRGIRVCDEWRHDFAAFLAHIGPKPSRSHSIDRIENERGYEPGNVRWATRREQMRNTRHNVPITHAGLTLCAAEWSLRTGVPATTIIARIRRGVPVARALDPSRMRTGPLPRVVAA